MPLNISPRLVKRTLSAVVIAPVVLWAIWAGGLPFNLMIVTVAGLALREWIRLSLKTAHKIFFALLGFFYIAAAFYACYLIRIGFGLETSLGFIAMVWASDTGAYVTGKLVGGPKLAPSISPNKTWAGFAGAMVFPVVVYFAIVPYLGGLPTAGYGLFLGIGVIFGIVTGFTGQAGDLLVSLFKRHVHVKDTGDIIPGHGGMLDRVDSLMLAAPVFWGILRVVNLFVH